MSKPLTIGNVAKASGVGVETVRFYERKGLVRTPKKSSLGGFRHYDPDDPKRIRFIKRAQDIGFTLREIKELLDLNESPRSTCEQVGKRAEVKITEVKDKIRDLKKMLSQLEELKSACGVDKGAVSCCRVMDCFDGPDSCVPQPPKRKTQS